MSTASRNVDFDANKRAGSCKTSNAVYDLHTEQIWRCLSLKETNAGRHRSKCTDWAQFSSRI